jgi:hypothetical protein
VDYPFDFFDLLYLDDFLYYLFDSNYLGHLYDAVHNLLDDFLDLDYLRGDSEYLKYIVDVDCIHDFCFDHADNALIHLEDCSGL